MYEFVYEDPETLSLSPMYRTLNLQTMSQGPQYPSYGVPMDSGEFTGYFIHPCKGPVVQNIRQACASLCL